MDILRLLPEGKFLFIWACLIILFSIVIRLILCIFKAIAIKQGEADYKEEYKEEDLYITFRDRRFGEIFQRLFFSCEGDSHIDDYFLPTLVGAFELVLFPILLFRRWDMIAFWITIKTAGNLGLRGKSRTSYNRFLFGNILVLMFSYILYIMFFS
ncbi:MAG: hypothetical protein V1842_00605 [Candidatus Omnitrophota bacterium]|nr:hypothetical protein [Candidatus Omnitrophota bacterium]MBU1928897.1 hypothetical protein [Candidatus Omnitrophota bacterium]MBU2034507.1 hypothetical protein [Candidatus Omnitrophota bacterium]MBU2258595.1 hypothetical protein [Candidatus Omnitrophota bacterium]